MAKAKKVVKQKEQKVITDPMEDTAEETKIYRHYLNQCMQIKKDIYDLMAAQHSKVDVTLESGLAQAKKIKSDLGTIVDDALSAKKSLNDESKSLRNALLEEARQLHEQRLLERAEMDKVLIRMDELESYIRDERFHDIVKEINSLECEFQERAMDIVKRRVRHEK